ncbi:MAG: hypothetical protein Q7R39_06865 [Dehalococcoidia bacterium]|nr:hypothetical protein [Dehalococcoidia bacterium]
MGAIYRIAGGGIWGQAELATKRGDCAIAPLPFDHLLHCYLTGRPGPSKGLDDFLAYTKKFPDVWYASYSDVANWWLAQGY